MSAGTAVVVQPVVSHTDVILDAVTGLLFLATLVLAIYTALLRKATLDLAADAIEGNRLSDKHHQESLTAICTVDSIELADDGDGYTTIQFDVQNVGAGPAIQVIVGVTPAERFSGEMELGQKAAPGFKKIGMSNMTLPRTLAAGAKRAHRYKLEFDSLREPRNKATDESALYIIVEVQFLTMFLTWGSGRWTVRKDECYSTLLSFELPDSAERVGVESRPNPLGADATAFGGRIVLPESEDE